MAGKPRHSREEALAQALARGASVAAAAKRSGYSTRQAFRKLAEPAFRARVAAARDAALGRTSARLSATSLAAVKTLRELLAAKSEAVRLGAARAILEAGSKMHETVVLSERLAAVEATLVARPAT